MFQLLVLIVLMLDVLLGGMTPVKADPTKENLYSYASELNTAFENMGYNKLEPIITFENLKGAKGASDAPYWQVNAYCGQDIAIGMQYRYPSYKFYNTIDIVPTLAHEMSHMYQGVNCDTKTVETDATLIGLRALSKMPKNSIYYQALLWQLRDLAIMRALDEKCDKTWMKDLSEEAQSLYGDTTCGYARSRHFYTDALISILKDKATDVDEINKVLGR